MCMCMCMCVVCVCMYAKEGSSAIVKKIEGLDGN